MLDILFNKHRHQKIISTNNRLRRIQGVAGVLEYQEWIDLCSSYDFRCVACGVSRPLCIDHVQPTSRGGLNIIANIQPLCRFCNSSKQDRFIDYRARPFQVRPALSEENYSIAVALRLGGATNKFIAARIGITQQAVATLLRGYWRELDDPRTKR